MRSWNCGCQTSLDSARRRDRAWNADESAGISVNCFRVGSKSEFSIVADEQVVRQKRGFRMWITTMRLYLVSLLLIIPAQQLRAQHQPSPPDKQMKEYARARTNPPINS